MSSAQVPDSWLVLVGDGEERQALAARAAEEGVAKCVIFAGWRDDIVAAHKAMDLFAFPSLNEGMGKALVEAMYSGLPIVATAVGGVPELIEHRRNGLLVPLQRPDLLADALLELAGDKVLMRSFGVAAAASALKYSAAHMVEKIVVLYEELLKQKGMESGEYQAH